MPCLLDRTNCVCVIDFVCVDGEYSDLMTCLFSCQLSERQLHLLAANFLKKMQRVAILEEHGLARVEGIPLEPYLGWQHTKMNPLIFNRIGFVALITAFEAGWLDRQGNFFTLAKYEAEPIRKNADDEADDKAAAERALVEAQHQFSTVFVASIATDIKQSSNLTLRGRTGGAVAALSVAHVGSSSFTLRVALSCGDEDFGSMLLSFVHVDFKARRPAPLPEGKRISLDDAKNKNALVTGTTPAAMQRLALAQLFQSVNGQRSHAKTFALRHSDFDFNLHLNQSMYQSFAVDALKESVMLWAGEAAADRKNAAGDDNEASTPSASTQSWVESFIQSFLLPHDASNKDTSDLQSVIQKNTLLLDASIESLRMDYLKEIQMPPITSPSAIAAPVPGVVCHISPLPEEPNAFLFCIRLDTDAPKEMRSAGVIRLSSIA
jgi:hypothetical protein